MNLRPLDKQAGPRFAGEVDAHVTKPRLLDLPHGYQTVIDEADWPSIASLTLYRGTNGYVYFSQWRDGRSQPQTLHSLLMQPPKGTHVDHINGDKLDNRRANLRVVSPSVNQANRRRRHPRNTSGVRGVGLFQGGPKWRAQITVDRKVRHLGLFDTLEEAAEARRIAEIEAWGEPCPDLG
jgi:hypothetical protein